MDSSVNDYINKTYKTSITPQSVISSNGTYNSAQDLAGLKYLRSQRLNSQKQTAIQEKKSQQKGILGTIADYTGLPGMIASGIGAAKALPGAYNIAKAGVQSLSGNQEEAKQSLEKAAMYGQEAVKPVNMGILGQYKPATTPQEVVGTGLKAGTTIAGFGAPLAASVAGKVGMGAVEGGLTFGGQAIEEGKSAGEVAKEALGGAAFGAATVGVIGALSKTPGLLKGGGKALYSLTSKMEEPTKIAVQNYKASLPTLMERISGLFKPIAKTTEKEPITEAMTGLTRGLVGTERQMGVQAVRAQNKLWNNIISPTLKSSPLKVDMKVFFKTLGKQIFKEEADLTRRNALLKALDAMKNDYIKVGKVSLSKLQDYKSGWAKFLPQKAFQGEDIAGAFKEVQNLAAKMLDK